MQTADEAVYALYFISFLRNICLNKNQFITEYRSEQTYYNLLPVRGKQRKSIFI